MSEKKALYNRKIPDLQRQNKKMSEGFIQRKFYGILYKRFVNFVKVWYSWYIEKEESPVLEQLVNRMGMAACVGGIYFGQDKALLGEMFYEEPEKKFPTDLRFAGSGAGGGSGRMRTAGRR